MEVGQLWVKLTLSDKDFKKGLKDTTGSFSGFMDSLAGKVVTLGSIIGAVATGAVTQFGINFNASMEQARIGFTTMLGSAEKADRFLRELAGFAKNTPFDFPGLRSTAQTMMALGFEAEEIIPTLTAIGDAMAAMGKDQAAIDRIIAQMGQIKTTGRATWEDIKVMSENGVKALDYLAEGLGTTVADVRDRMKDGAIDADTAIRIITEGMEKDFGGMMKDMETTWNGMVSNIRDGAGFLVGTAFEPVFNVLKTKVLPIIKDTVTALQENLDTGGGLAGALQILVPPGLKDELKLVSDYIGNLKTKIAEQDWEGIGRLLGDSLATALDNVKDFGVKAVAWIQDQMGQINWADIGRASVSVAVGFVLGFVDGLFNPAVWLDIVQKYWWELLGVVLTIILAPAKILQPFINALRKIPLAGKFLAWLIESISSIGKSALAPIGNLFKDMGNFFMGAFLKALGLEGGKLLPLFRGLIDDTLKGIKSFGEDLYLRAAYFMERLGAGITNFGPKQVVQAVQRLIGEVDIALRLAAEKAVTWGRNIVTGLWNGISSVAGWIKTKVTEFVSSIGTTIKDFFGISSPSKLMAEYGRYLAEGLAQGMGEKIQQVKDMAQVMAESITGALNKVSGSLNLTAEIARAQFDLLVVKMGENADQGELLKAKLEMLNKEYAVSGDKIAMLQQAYEDMKKVKGEAADETRELYLELLREQKAQIDLAKSIAEVNRVQQTKAMSAEDVTKAFTSGGASIFDVQLAWLTQHGKQIAWDGSNFIPGAAAGGVVASSGSVLVGEKGPEILDLPKGAKVTPLDRTGTANHYHFAPGSVVIPAKDLEEMRTIQDFFDRVLHTARTMG